jgi:hypothetical protein
MAKFAVLVLDRARKMKTHLVEAETARAAESTIKEAHPDFDVLYVAPKPVDTWS